jgi:hypothetical protein
MEIDGVALEPEQLGHLTMVRPKMNGETKNEW